MPFAYLFCMKLRRILIAAAYSGFCLLFSCVKHHIEIDRSCQTEISYQDQVSQIVTAKCAIPACHNGDMGANLDWRDFQNFQSRADEVRRRIQLPASDPEHMPRRGALTTGEIQTIVCWVQQGALDN